MNVELYIIWTLTLKTKTAVQHKWYNYINLDNTLKAPTSLIIMYNKTLISLLTALC